MSKLALIDTTCERCGKTLPPNAPGGLCPYCLGALNLSGLAEVADEPERVSIGAVSEAGFTVKLHEREQEQEQDKE